MSCDECTPWHASWSELVGHTGDRYGSLTDGRAIGYAVTMLRSHVFLCFQTRNSRCPQRVVRRVERRGENADRSGTGGSSRPKKEQKVAASQEAGQGAHRRRNRSDDRSHGSPRRAHQNLQSCVTSIEHVSQMYSVNLLCMHVVYI